MQTSRIDDQLNLLSELSQLKLKRVFDAFRPVDLIIESSLLKPLETICSASWLKSNGVHKIYKFERRSKVSYENTPLFLIRANFADFKHTVDQCKFSAKECHILLFPQIVFSFEQYLESQGLSGKIVLHEFQWLPIVWDPATVSLEYEHCFKQLLVFGDYSYLRAIAKSLWELSLIFGNPGEWMLFGSQSLAIFDQFEIIDRLTKASCKPNSQFSSWILIDRSVDLISLLLTPFTYFGLLMEIFDVKMNRVKLKTPGGKSDEKLNPVKKTSVSEIVLDTSKDYIYALLKNEHFRNVSSRLSDEVKKLKAEKQKCSNSATLSDLRQSVRQIKPLSLKEETIAKHLQLSELLLNEVRFGYDSIDSMQQSMLCNMNKTENLQYIEDSLICDNNLAKTLKLFCLLSQTQNLTINEYEDFKRKFLHEFGFKLLYVFDYLESAKLLLVPSKSTSLAGKLTLPALNANPLQNFCRKFKLLPDKTTDVNDSHVFNNAYTPLVAKIVAHIAANKDTGNFYENFSTFKIKNRKIRTSSAVELSQKTILVCVVGGITAAEMATLETLEKQLNVKIVNFATNLISWNSLVDELVYN